MKAGSMRHIVDVLRPSKALDGRGQAKAFDVAIKGIPCSVEELSGKKYEDARSLYAEASLRVEMYGDPNNPITTADVLLLNGKRRLKIGYVGDVMQNGFELTLLCGEDRA